MKRLILLASTLLATLGIARIAHRSTPGEWTYIAGGSKHWVRSYSTFQLLPPASWGFSVPQGTIPRYSFHSNGQEYGFRNYRFGFFAIWNTETHSSMKLAELAEMERRSLDQDLPSWFSDLGGIVATELSMDHEHPPVSQSVIARSDELP